MALLKKNQSNTAMSKGTVSLIAEGLKIYGNLHAQSNLRIDGEFVGNIIVLTKLVVGKNGKIKGNIIGNDILVEGTVEGNILAKNILELLPSANISGNILTDKLKVESGSLINGKCYMGKQVAEKIKNFKFPNWEVLSSAKKAPIEQEIQNLLNI